MNKQIILVTGATGAQGGSVAKALLADNKFAVRIFTRTAASAKPKELKQLGAEIAEGDFNDMQSLLEAMKDCYAVYGVTNYWEHFDEEYQQGKNLIDAVKQSGIQHFVYSSLPSYSKLSMGKYSVPHCDIKADLEQYARALQIPSTFVHVAFYYQNFLSFFQLQDDGNGNLFFGFPQGDTRLAAVSVEDCGAVVAGIFNHPQEYIGRKVGIVGDDKSCAEYAAILSRELGRKVYFRHMNRDTYAAMDFCGAEELANMFEVQRLHISNRLLDLIESNALNPAMQSFEQWVRNNKMALEAVLPSTALVEDNVY